VKVRWTESAVHYLVAIHDYIARDSPTYALRVVDRLTRRSQQIGQFPHSGRVVPECDLPHLREVIEGPYRIREDQIEVVAVIHGAKQALWSV
jgi:plasmid stabilization system protein ParE